VPTYSVFDQVFTRMDGEAFARLPSGWLQQRASELSAALALDRKMIRDHVSILTLAQHEDSAPPGRRPLRSEAGLPAVRTGARRRADRGAARPRR
jgi:hypothetical protein